MSHRKPLDLGNGLVCASFGADGSWLSVGATHPEVGLVELTGAPAFAAEDDGRVDLVRTHRARLTDPTTAMLRVVDSTPEATVGGAGWTLRGAGWEAQGEAWAEDGPTLVQRHALTSEAPGSLRLEFRGRLGRPAYAEITPGGPIPPALPPQAVALDGARVHVRVPLGADDPAAHIEITSSVLSVDSWVATEDGAVIEVSWHQPILEAPLLVTVTLSCGEPALSPRPRGWWTWGTAPTGLVSSGLAGLETAAVRYTMGCTALEVTEGRCCILTDHRLLPLSWTRDAYYQAALLLADVAEHPERAGVVERHLAWLWRSGRDDAGVWRRSHLSSGAVKDSGYQVDQQLFPLLELVDFRRATGRWPLLDPDAWGPLVRRVWAGLPRDENGLVPGEENPADDPSELPYLLSSQLLLAYVARRLAEFGEALGMTDLRLAHEATQTLESVGEVFRCSGPFGDQWAYEADGVGGHRRYHDANDVPTALAPLWGLCEADDPLWRATMAFAFSEHNSGFVRGRHSGLGSAHTPGVWPLGDAQEWAVATAQGDRARVERVVSRITRTASTDGMLPETYDAQTGDWLARHWFAWPGSLVGLLHATFGGRGPWVTR